jgi:hypothetical protein
VAKTADWKLATDSARRTSQWKNTIG